MYSQELQSIIYLEEELFKEIYSYNYYACNTNTQIEQVLKARLVILNLIERMKSYEYEKLPKHKLEQKCNYCKKQAAAILVDCYHDGSPIDPSERDYACLECAEEQRIEYDDYQHNRTREVKFWNELTGEFDY